MFFRSNFIKILNTVPNIFYLFFNIFQLSAIRLISLAYVQNINNIRDMHNASYKVSNKIPFQNNTPSLPQMQSSCVIRISGGSGWFIETESMFSIITYPVSKQLLLCRYFLVYRQKIFIYKYRYIHYYLKLLCIVDTLTFCPLKSARNN